MRTKFILFFLFISVCSLAQDGNKSIDQAFKQIDSREGVSYFEVTKDMFKMLSESREISPEFKEYISKLHQLKMIQPGGAHRTELGEELYKTFMENANLKDYTRLMTQRDERSKISFYKKDGNNENEFLLVSNNMIIYITGTLDLQNMHQFEQIIDIAGNALGM
ncbi:DUF4252 domain-containing protein [Draconibacterium sp. IB214405]|uniref:DUF4252 domain-containing protein n=1 Tax=Draconibacterium sp. IB214405 TaxID=3097352 RepID=UPI002A17473B|nr:DUF4252 domain-containing protein [Draconibacterium sp. IB214405]MDX8341235.1 DUF4252 domain-containing protein [Draconibacterium sp. IB214405]